MSVAATVCPSCNQECRCAGIHPHPPDQQVVYGVVWQCPTCGYRALDMCNVGPLVPGPESCLNCGVDYAPGDEACSGCNIARAEVLSFLGLGPEPPANVVQAAANAFGRGLCRHAMGLLNQALQRDRTITDAWDLKYRFLEGLRFFGAAEAMLQRALDQGAPRVLLARYGGVLALRGAHAEAATVYQSFLDEVPADPRTLAIVRAELGRSQAALGDVAAAEASYRQALSAWPENALIHLNLGALYLQKGQWPEAVAALDQGLALAKAPLEGIGLLEAKAHALCGLTRGAEALACVEQSQALGANSSRTHYLRGRALAMLGRLEEARASMQQVLQLDPNVADAQQALDQIDAALRSQGQSPGTGG